MKYRPSQPFDSNTSMNFTIPGNSSQYVSLCESYMFVQCHIEETDQFGNPITTSNTPLTPAAHSKGNVAKEFKMDDEEDEGYEMGEGDEDGEEEEDMEQEEEDKPKATRVVPSNIPPCPYLAFAQDVEEFLVEAEHRYIKWQRVWTSFKNETNLQEKTKKRVLAENLEDMVLLSMCQYLSAKHMRRKERLYQNALTPIYNVLHSIITMKGELVSTTNQKYLYKSYFETVLNNSHSTKYTN